MYRKHNERLLNINSTEKRRYHYCIRQQRSQLLRQATQVHRRTPRQSRAPERAQHMTHLFSGFVRIPQKWKIAKWKTTYLVGCRSTPRCWLCPRAVRMPHRCPILPRYRSADRFRWHSPACWICWFLFARFTLKDTLPLRAACFTKL